MHEELLSAIFVLLATDMLLPIRTTPPRHAQCDMKQFVNTSEVIWTYKTTYTRNISCECNKMECMTPLDIRYKRNFLFDQQRCSIPLRGQFLPLYPERMTVMTRALRPVSAEILLYLAADLSCAVMKVRTIGRRAKVRIDLRVRNSTILRGIVQPECRRHFRHAVKSRLTYHEYNRGCQYVYIFSTLNVMALIE
ncbi:uncharacterized protein LOC119372167 isoform X2 [Rhipicephalus sanguineus]|uniref:uncharacterized protein LOC119372167 isoform X2 n=1 Tax=Rhipicephalus sanguineus TaxID=34632 RepID=UPI0020C1E6A1|nr:uncharacterized protein LOC119372167 isoform X2 [Rhipicephalus sanguineus]